MTYHCGVGPLLAGTVGMEPCDPHITCDDCGRVYSLTPARNTAVRVPPMWLLDNKAPRGWEYERTQAGTRHYCQRCK